MSLDKDFDTLVEMMATLLDDVRRCYEGLKAAEKAGTPKDQCFWRRVNARAVFSAIEGSCELFRRQAFLAELNTVANK